MKYINVNFCLYRHIYIKNYEICWPGDAKLGSPVDTICRVLWTPLNFYNLWRS